MGEEQVGVDLPNEDLTLYFRNIEIAMSDQDSMNPAPQDEASDKSELDEVVEPQQDEDACRILFFNLLRPSDDKTGLWSQSLYLMEGCPLE